jgi:hypothetical protein
MEFYEYDNENNFKPIQSTGIDITTMCEIFNILGKTEKYKYVDDMIGYQIVHADPKKCEFNALSEQSVVFKNKKVAFILAKSTDQFTITNLSTKEITYAVINNGTLLSDKKSISLEKEKEELAKKLTSDELLAYNWLETGHTGNSSKTICGTLFPKLREIHSSYSNKNDHINDYPRDNADFGRCVEFLDTIPGSRALLSKMSSVSPEWEKLIDNWQILEDYKKNGYTKDLYNTICLCVNKPVNKNKP